MLKSRGILAFDVMTERINAIIMLEILGKPEKHVKKTLADIVDKLGKEKDVKLLNKKIAEPKQLENQEVFTSFAEVELETNLQTLMLLIFGYMPSHIEIIEPEELKVNNADLNLFLNELAKKLHQYDEIAKTLMLERQIFSRQLQEQIKNGKLKVEIVGKKEKRKPAEEKIKIKAKKKKK